MKIYEVNLKDNAICSVEYQYGFVADVLTMYSLNEYGITYFFITYDGYYIDVDYKKNNNYDFNIELPRVLDFIRTQKLKEIEKF